MNPDEEIIEEFEQDGWHVTVSLVPDYDYRPGEDDDIYPVLEWVSPNEYPEERDYDGTFLPQPIIVPARDGLAKVSPEQIEELAEKWGTPKRRARKMIERDARAIASENLTWVGVIVRASRGEIVGEDSLWGVEYDLREREPDKYARETVRESGMVEEAIRYAAEKVAGGYATQALSY